MTGIALSPILSETDHRHFLEHGYVLLRGVVPESAIEEAVAALEASEEARASNPGTQPFFHTQLPEVDEAIPMQAIQRAGLELIGPDHPVNLPQRLVYIPRRLQQDDARLDRWHIDLVYPMLTPDAWAINTFVFLTRVKVGGGAFHFDKGSPRRVRAELLRNGMSTVRGDGKLRIGPGEPVEFLAEPGDILLYSYLMGHTASINTSDPQTRHAFAAGIFQLTDRLVTKDRPVEAMSTAEKASSTRYHRSVDPSLPDYTPAPDAPRSPATGGRLRTHVTLRDQGRIHLLLVEDARPNVVRNFSTTDWSRWDEAPPLVLDTATSITRLDWEHRPEPGLLVSVEEPGGARVRRFRGESFAESRFVELDAVEDAIAAENTYAHPAYGARQAQGDIELRVPASDPTRVEWTCAMETGSPSSSPRDGASSTSSPSPTFPTIASSSSCRTPPATPRSAGPSRRTSTTSRAPACSRSTATSPSAACACTSGHGTTGWRATSAATAATRCAGRSSTGRSMRGCAGSPPASSWPTRWPSSS